MVPSMYVSKKRIIHANPSLKHEGYESFVSRLMMWSMIYPPCFSEYEKQSASDRRSS